MTEPDRHRSSGGRGSTAPVSVVWNTVVPALGVALLLGAPLLPALAIAAALSVAITAVVRRAARDDQPSWPPARVADPRL